MPLQCRGHCKLDWVGRVRGSPLLLRVEEEKLVPTGVELPGNVDRASHRKPKIGIPVQWLRQAAAIEEEVIGIEHLMALEPVCAAVEILSARPSDQRHRGTEISPVLGSVVARRYPQFGHRHSRLEQSGAIRVRTDLTVDGDRVPEHASPIHRRGEGSVDSAIRLHPIGIKVALVSAIDEHSS